MYIIDVKVRHAPVGEGAHDRLFDVLLPVEGVPELRHDPHVASLDDPVFESPTEAGAAFLLVSIV